jgi:enediyne biosynthesis protein E4
VSTVSLPGRPARNVLYINNGDGTFTDRAKEAGLDHGGFGTQALFFDYDMDGDLDVYLLNHATHTERGIGSSSVPQEQRDIAADRLMRNDGMRFVDVSAAAGLVRGLDGFGLGVVATDINGDACPDLYVANDFQEDDLLYVNNCDGTFTESMRTATGHTSRYSMGVDAADVDNDGRPDVFVGDMLPEREEILKTSAGVETFNLFNLRLRAGYQAQYPRNTLQLNRGSGRFSEIGYYAGVHASDWTWGPLFADLDLDGHKDLFVTNGIVRRPNDLDYINYVGNEARQAALARGDREAAKEIISHMPQVRLPNYAFRNGGDLRFHETAASWGLGEAGWSSGAAYVDLNNDGALDLVVNNVNGTASIYRSRARESTGNRYLVVRLSGPASNTLGIGTTVTLFHGGKRQVLEQQPVRGFQSSVDPRLHFGVGKADSVDSVLVVWPDRRFEMRRNVSTDQSITLSHSEAAGKWSVPELPMRKWFADVTRTIRSDFVHRENTFLDTDREPLMPVLLSREGPALAAADINGDGLDDLFVGGAKGQPSTILVQRADGSFARDESPFVADSLSEDVAAIFFDADSDGDADLYVVTAGNEFWGDAEELRDRLYINDGRGRLRKSTGLLPAISENGGCVTAGDYDGDGDVDLFVGSRVVSRAYGTIPRSHLLRNDGSGRFADVTESVAPLLRAAGMVTTCAWIGRPGSRLLDLVVAGEWMPVRLFRMEGGRFVERTTEAGLANTAGLWTSLEVADLNGDGLQDMVLGNTGLNSYIRAAQDKPARMYVSDFGGTGVQKQILEFFKHDTSYPVAGRDDIVKLIPSLRSRYPSYKSFGASRVTDIFTSAELRDVQVLSAREMASMVAIARDDGAFTLSQLPRDAQFSPVYAVLARDFDGDGRVDLLLGGNQHGVAPMLGRYDASYGTLLRGTGTGTFTAVDLAETGVVIDGEVRGIASVRTRRGYLLAVASQVVANR